MTLNEFAKIYCDSLSKQFPTATFSQVNEDTIECKFHNNVIRISADNAYKEYLVAPNSVDEILKRYLKTIGELFDSGKKINVDRIVPVIKPIRYLEDVRNQATKAGLRYSEVIYEKYNDQLIIVYAEDTENGIHYLTRDDMPLLTIKEDSIKIIALRNLNALLKNITARGSGGIYMIICGGNYESSLILLDNVLKKETFPLRGDFVIAIPNRDMFLVTGSSESDGIARIKEFVKKSFTTGNYPVSEYLYKWNGNSFEKYSE